VQLFLIAFREVEHGPKPILVSRGRMNGPAGDSLEPELGERRGFFLGKRFEGKLRIFLDV